MAESPTDGNSKGALRALFSWLKGGTPAPQAVAATHGGTGHGAMPARLGHYTIARKLGQGGMGVVYEARDDRPYRSVAVKAMSGVAGDERARRRFWREARAAAGRTRTCVPLRWAWPVVGTRRGRCCARWRPRRTFQCSQGGRSISTPGWTAT